MQADRELLELAAKAAGLGEFVSINGSGAVYAPRPGIMQPYQRWNPLTDDGDALRLAAKLGINIDFNDCCAWNRGAFGLVQEFWGGDFDPCYRNAIVRAAAEIGRGMG